MMEVSEDDFMSKQRDPFKRIGSVRIGATNQFVLTVAMFDEFGLAELLDDLAASVLLSDMI